MINKLLVTLIFVFYVIMKRESSHQEKLGRDETTSQNEEYKYHKNIVESLPCIKYCLKISIGKLLYIHLILD